MIKTTVKVDGMMCGMCEAHVNDAVRAAFNVKKVSSSRSKGMTEIISEEPIDSEKLIETINSTGYTATDVRSEPFQKRRFPMFGE